MIYKLTSVQVGRGVLFGLWNDSLLFSFFIFIKNNIKRKGSVEKTLPFLLEKKVDYVIDAIDSLNSKCGLIEALIKNNIPFISSMGAALKTDPTHIKYATLDKTQNCGLAKFVRKRLKKRGADITKVECVFSDEQTNSEEKGFIENKEEGVRNTLGSLPTITAIFGLMIANKVILEISKKKA